MTRGFTIINDGPNRRREKEKTKQDVDDEEFTPLEQDVDDEEFTPPSSTSIFNLQLDEDVGRGPKRQRRNHEVPPARGKTSGPRLAPSKRASPSPTWNG